MKRFILFFLLTSALSGLIIGQGVSPDFKQIVGGEDVDGAEEFPFVAKIIYGSYSIGCTGSLIAPDKVVTAAHCLHGYSKAKISIGFGNLRSSGSRHKAVKIRRHPEYSIPHNDIAVIEFRPPVSIRPVPVLTLEEELLYAPSGGLVTAVGWGNTLPGMIVDFPQTLQKIVIPVYTPEDCRRVLEDLRSQGEDPAPPAILEQTLCAGERNRTSGSGDSGGPLLAETPLGWALIGVLSQTTRNKDRTVRYMSQWMRTSYLRDFIFPTYTLHFAHSAVGGGWTTDLVLLNPYLRKTVEATIDVFSSDGRPRISERISLQSNGVEEWLPVGGEEIETGGVVVSSPEKLSGFLRFRHKDGAATSVQDAPVSDAFMLPLSSRVDRVGIAVFNVGDEELTVVIRVGDMTVHKTIPAQAKIASFVDELFPAHRVSVDAVTVRTDPPGGQITVLALEVVGGSLVTLPAVVLDE